MTEAPVEVRCPGAAQPATETWVEGERLGICPHCGIETNVTVEGLVWDGHETTIKVPIHEQTETIRWSLFPPGHDDLSVWSIAAHHSLDGWWYLQAGGIYFHCDRRWAYGPPDLEDVARLTLDEARTLAQQLLPSLYKSGRTAASAYALAKEAGSV